MLSVRNETEAATGVLGSQDLVESKRLILFSKSSCSFAMDPIWDRFPNPELNALVTEGLESAETLGSEWHRGQEGGEM